MLNEAKLAMGISDAEYEPEIASLIMSGAAYLRMKGVIIDGEVSFGISGGTVTDNCTVSDPLITRALITWAQANANWQTKEKAERYGKIFDGLEGSLMHGSGYTDYGEGAP